jgi:hypothetical protein
MKSCIISGICIFALLEVAWGQTNLQGISDSEGDEILALIKNLHLAQTSLAYRSAVGQRMLEEANYFSEQLKLPPPHPIQIADITGFHVSPPWFSKIENTNLASPVARVRTAKIVAGGNLQTTNFSFSFSKGKLFGVENRIMYDERFDLYPVWAKTSSLINSDGAYQLATQWLAAVDIDVGALNKQTKPKVEQRWFWNQPGLNVYHPPRDTNKTMLPIYEVTWGTNWVNYPAQVQILGTTKELMKLHVGDFSLFHRPPLVITNAIELVNIPDPPMKHLERQTNSP